MVGEYGSGFLAENAKTGKRLLYLEGTHYDIGYQVGYLCPEGVQLMVHDYCNDVLFEMLDLPFASKDLGPLWEFIRTWLEDLVVATEDAVPTSFREEMQGIADGYASASAMGRVPGDMPVEYADVLLLNQGMDAISSLTYNGLGKAGLACNQFACWGPHTKDGRLFHGRDFQFYTAGVYQDVSLVAVYRPLHEDRTPSGYPFVAVTAPGFVGQATILNSQGISMGIDVVHSWAASEGIPGLSGLLLTRNVAENAGNMDDAIGIIRDADRGCPWIFLVADGKTRNAAALETVQSYVPLSWMAQRLEEAEALGNSLIGQPFSCSYPDRGVMIRHSDFTLPHLYKNRSIELPGYYNSPKYKDDPTFLNLDFPDPLEDLPDMIAATNHFLLPEMRPFQWAPLISLVWRSYWPSTEWRYQTLVELLLDRSASGAALDWIAAWKTIDFLNPTNKEGSFYHGPETDQEVGGHVALMDNEDLVLRALYGYYNDPWVEIRLRDFLP